MSPTGPIPRRPQDRVDRGSSDEGASAGPPREATAPHEGRADDASPVADDAEEEHTDISGESPPADGSGSGDDSAASGEGGSVWGASQGSGDSPGSGGPLGRGGEDVSIDSSGPAAGDTDAAARTAADAGPAAAGTADDRVGVDDGVGDANATGVDESVGIDAAWGSDPAGIRGSDPTSLGPDTVPELQVTPPAGVQLPQPLPSPPSAPYAGPSSVVLAPPPTRRRPRRARRPRPSRPVGGRVVKERLRHIDPWSVFKISAIFYVCLVTVLLVTGVLLWLFAHNTGTVDDMESFVSELFTYGDCVPEDDLALGQEAEEHENCPEGQLMVGSFEINGGALFRSALLGGTLFVVIATIGTVFVVLLFNLLSDMVGGVRYSVVREPLDTATRSTRSRQER